MQIGFVPSHTCKNSAILFAVRNSVLFISLLILSLAALAIPARQAPSPPTQPNAQSSTQSSSQTGAQPPTPQVPPSSPPQISPPQPNPGQQPYTGPVVVLDPAHGGIDNGARGQNGAIEKDIVLQFARAVRAELIRQGYRAVLTRDDDSNPSYDDRSATANSYREPIFVSLHLSSTGTAGTARAYYYQFWSPLPPPAPLPSSSSTDQTVAPIVLSAPASTTLTRWEEAQRPFAATSQRFADELQNQLAAAFPGSPATSTAAAIRGLRSVNAPAVAIEISSVSVTDAKSLTGMAAPLSTSVAKAIQAFRPLNSAGVK